MQSLIFYGIIFSLLAGISTAIGGAIAFFIQSPQPKLLSPTLGFSAGVMIAVSFFELLPKAISDLGFLYAIIAFFLGIFVILIIDILVPHEYIAENIECKNPHLMKVGVFTAIGIAIHNFPEGFAVFAPSLHSIKTGLLIAIAIAIHNIPEGISVSVPIFCATHNHKRAFNYSLLAGISEPVGAIIGALILFPFLSPFVVSLVLAFVAGIMVYISFDELLPAAHKYGEEHLATCGIIVGMIVMTLTLIFLR